MSASAAPSLTAAESRVAKAGTPVPLALEGPVTTEAREVIEGRVRIALDFDEPILGYRRLEATGGEVVGVVFTPGDSRLEAVIDGVRADSRVTLRVVEAVSATGIADAEAHLLLFAADFNGDGVRSALDLRAFRITPEPNALTQTATASPDLPALIKRYPVLRFLWDDVRAMPNLEPVGRIVNERDDDRMMPRYASPGGSSLPITIRLRDDRDPEDAVIVRARSTNQSVVADADISIIGVGAERTVTFIGAPAAQGTSHVVVTLDDGERTSEIRFVAGVGPNTAPEAIALVDTFVGPSPLIARFDATDSFDNEDNIAGYAWDFAGLASSSSPTPTFAFKQAGTYDVTLTVTDADGLTDTATRTITVADSAWSASQTVTEAEARRFLWQGAFGPSDDDVAFVMANGFEAWIDAQRDAAPNYITSELRDQADALGVRNDVSSIWDGITVTGDDQLRQRIAWALAQVFPLRADAHPYITYSLFIQNALPDPQRGTTGNFREMLSDITYDHNMGNWLTYRGNKKADPALGTLPDQNYAREVQQLFTIGLWELHPDGSRLADLFGDPIPAYDQANIEQFSRIFTGLRGGYSTVIMEMNPDVHEFGETLLHDYPEAVPAGGMLAASEESEFEAYLNIEQALDNLFYHPSSPPFVCELLIKRTTVSNPSPAYIQRVARAYQGLAPYGKGVRGDLHATFKAILLDDEARNPAYRTNPDYGKVLEPLVIRAGVHRALDSLPDRGLPFPFEIEFGWVGSTMEDFGQAFMRTPSVFNFYRPDFAPLNTPIAERGLSAPELQIHDDNTALESLGEFDDICRTDQLTPERYAELVALSSDPAALVDWVIRVLHYEATDPAIRQIIVDTVAASTNNNPDTQADRRIRLAIGLVTLNPGFRHLR